MIMLLVFASSVIGIILVLPGADPKVLYSLVPICALSGIAIRVPIRLCNLAVEQMCIICYEAKKQHQAGCPADFPSQ